ncbi:putative acyltransferase, group 3; O-antigen acetylase; membrane protein [Bradyrhizobium sp. ORS 285]|uniref:acyltransferase family protein n=1 Tax=Bradyrhizobium sp. ORS 285 TaxID=115808 RepID=UPI000310DA53|nr:acyltransferase family protein [Bradyrhizobium sp. ORS 285]SMX57195.1 putative acyltransferase, group 3; O-antigen acetylase; membrane protein [Bradyrhizobium sp. ORS 285]
MNFAQPNLSQQEARATRLGYRQDIDGLRAVAVLPVLVYHAFPAAVPGGFYGVDIFFVISGYLITGIIHKQMLSGTFSIADFYARRIRRIFPALITVVLVTFLIGWFVLPPRELKSLGTNIAGGAVFVQNFILLGQVGYFDLAAEKKPLLHLWSLAIEEQYYIVWPLLLMLIGSWRRRSLAITLVLAAASFVACLIVQPRAPDHAFYLPVTRAWELLVGSGLALWVNGRAAEDRPLPLIGAPIVGELVALAAMIAIALAFWRYGRPTPHPGGATLLPVLGAAALIATSGTLVHRYILSTMPAVFVGLISYPLYLWHYPLMAYARIQLLDAVPASVMVAIIAASLVLAWATYHFIERPIRFGWRLARLKVGGLLGGMIALGIVGVVADRTNGLPVRIPADLRGFMLTGEETSVHWRRGKCLLLPDQSAADFASECAGDGRHPLIVVWGDSFGSSLYPGLAHFKAERGFEVAEFTASACPPLLDYVQPDRSHCRGANDFVAERLASLKPELVILYSTWSYSAEDLRKGLELTVARLRNIGVPKVILLGPPATWLGDGLVSNLLDYYFQTHSLLPVRTFYRSNDNWTRALEEFLEGQAKALGIQYVSTRKIMCNNDGCLARIGKDGADLTSYDIGHLTYPGSIFVARQVLDAIPGFEK